MKRLLFLLCCLFILSSCSAPATEKPREVPDPYFDEALVFLQWDEGRTSGCFSFSEEQLFTFSMEEPARLRGAFYSFSPTKSSFSFAELSQEPLPQNTPVFLFYRALCTMTDKAKFAETETGFLAEDFSLSILTEEDSLILITENMKATISPQKETPELP